MNKNQDCAIRITTHLGKDVFEVLSFSGTEYISKLYSFELQLVSKHSDLNFDQLGGKNVTVAIRSFDGAEHFFNGIIVAFEACGHWVKEGFRKFRARLVPAVWVLNQWIDCRIFQYKSVPDIIEEVLVRASLEGPRGMQQKIDFRMELNDAYGIKEYCEQDSETDFAFISRLCQSEGIFYYFEHQYGRHPLVFTDDRTRIKRFANGGKRTVTFLSLPDGRIQTEDECRSATWHHTGHCKMDR